MNKQEKDYLYNRLAGEARLAKSNFATAHPLEWTREEIKASLERDGYTVQYSSHGITKPPTQDMIRNDMLYSEFARKVDEALCSAKDAIYIGRAEAVSILTNFKESLRTLTNA